MSSCTTGGMDRFASDVFEPGARYRPRPWPRPWTARGVIDVLEPWVNAERKQRIAQVLDARIAHVTVLLDALHDPHNGAAIMRSCDAFGVQEVHVVPRDDPFAASNIVSKGAERWVDVIEHPTPASAVSTLSSAGFELVTAHPDGELEPEALAEIPKLALILGNEHDGVREELAQSAGRRVQVPMRGFVESLNVSVSAAILLRAATRDRPGDLQPEHRLALYAQGLVRSLKRAQDILDASAPR